MKSGYYNAGVGLILLDNIECSGSEENLLQCPHRGVGVVSFCDHSRDAGVICRMQGNVMLWLALKLLQIVAACIQHAILIHILFRMCSSCILCIHICNSDLEQTSCEDGDIRLVGGSITSEGSVEICYGGHWLSVCDKEWGEHQASAICTQLGLGGEGERTNKNMTPVVSIGVVGV